MLFSNIFNQKNYNLLSEMVRMDFKLRYQGSVLGYLWSLLRPLMLFGVLYIVFTKFLRFGDDVPNFAISLLLGIVLWTFFAEASALSVGSIVSSGNLIRKIKIPKYLIVVSVNISAVINLSLNLIVIFIFMFFSSVDITPRALLILPLLIELIAFALGVSFILSALFVKFRDVSYIWEVVIQMMFYATPILYPLTLVPNINAQIILMINPVAQIIQGARAALINPGTLQMQDLTSNVFLIFTPFLIVSVAILVAVIYFRKASPSFAENV